MRGILPVIGLAVLLVVTLVTTSVWAILRGDVIGVRTREKGAAGATA